jgi:hypothetical protein
MSALDLTVFRTSDPKVLAAWDQMQVEAEAYFEASKVLVADLGFPPGHGTFIRNRRPGQILTGFAIPEGGVPEGWRADNKTTGMMVPRQNTKIGRAAHAKILALGTRPDGGTVVKDFGMPPIAFVGLRLLSCGVARQGDVVWVKWSLDPRRDEDTEHNGFDLTLWEHVPLSEFARMFEEGNDPWLGESS